VREAGEFRVDNQSQSSPNIGTMSDSKNDPGTGDLKTTDVVDSTDVGGSKDTVESTDKVHFEQTDLPSDKGFESLNTVEAPDFPDLEDSSLNDKWSILLAYGGGKTGGPSPGP